MKSRRTAGPPKSVIIAAWIAVGFLILPTLVIFPVSFTAKDYLAIPSLSDLSLRHYRAFLEPETRWLTSFVQSGLVALGSALGATVLGTAMAIGIWRVSGRAGEWLLAFSLTPLMVPTVILALGDYWVWSRLGLYDSHVGLIVAHTVWTFPLVVVSVLTSLANVDLALERAAQSVGASTPRFLLDVLLPSVRPGVFAGAAVAFVMSWDELVLALFLTGRGVLTLPRRLWEGLRDDVDPTVAVASTFLICATVIGVVVKYTYERRQRAMT